MVKFRGREEETSARGAYGRGYEGCEGGKKRSSSRREGRRRRVSYTMFIRVMGMRIYYVMLCYIFQSLGSGRGRKKVEIHEGFYIFLVMS